MTGYIQSQPTANGADVKEGDLLYKIDDRDYQAALDQAKAQVQRDTAAAEYARSNYGRGDELAKSGYLSKDSAPEELAPPGPSALFSVSQLRKISSNSSGTCVRSRPRTAWSGAAGPG